VTPAKAKPRTPEPKVVFHPSWKQTVAVILSVGALGSAWSAFQKSYIMPGIVEDARLTFATREAVEGVSDQVRDLRAEMRESLRRIEDRLLQLERGK
jgi:hypothetical protein